MATGCLNTGKFDMEEKLVFWVPQQDLGILESNGFKVDPKYPHHYNISISGQSEVDRVVRILKHLKRAPDEGNIKKFIEICNQRPDYTEVIKLLETL